MDDVQETVQETTEATPSVAEETTNVPEATPVVESNDTEETVSKEVFLDRLNKEIEKRKGLEEKLNEVISRQAPAQPQTQYDVPDLDPDSTRAVQHLANQVAEQREVAKFMAKHATELQADPLLDAAMRVEFDKAAAKGGYVDREALLERAKAALDARMKPAQEAAKQAGLEEGRDIAKTKQQLGAVGETAKTPELDESKLSPAEFRKLHNIPRMD
jgi:hypothetical protein